MDQLLNQNYHWNDVSWKGFREESLTKHKEPIMVKTIGEDHEIYIKKIIDGIYCEYDIGECVASTFLCSKKKLDFNDQMDLARGDYESILKRAKML